MIISDVFQEAFIMKKALNFCLSLFLTITIILGSACVCFGELSCNIGFGIKTNASAKSELTENEAIYTQEWSLANPREYMGTYLVDVKLRTNYPCSSIQFKLNADNSEAVTLNSVTTGPALSSDYSAFFSASSNMVSIYCTDYTKSVTSVDGVVATLEFLYMDSEEVNISIENNPKTNNNLNGSLVALRYDNDTKDLYFGQSISLENNIFRLPLSEDFLEFELSSDETYYSVIGYKGEPVNLDIPYTYNGLPVLNITEDAFLGCESLISVTIPDSMIFIGALAFSDCVNIASVTLGNGLMGLGEDAFYNCSSLLSINIPDCVEFLEKDAFYGCSKLETIRLADGIDSLDSSVFNNTAYYNNPSNWFDNVLYIDNYLIDVKPELEGSCKIKEGTKFIVNNAFSYCNELTSVVIPEGVISIGSKAFSNCTKLVNVDFPDTVVTILDSAFNYCSSLISVNIPDSVMELGRSVFLNCTSLASVSLGVGLECIEDRTFYNCRSLVKVVIPENVTGIGSYAFESCTSLESIAVPKKLKNIGDRSFYSCDTLKYVFYSGSQSEWQQITLGNNNIKFTNAFVHYNSQDHSLDNVQSLAPTCTTEGFLKGDCTVCDLMYNEVIPALGHDFSTEWTIDIEPTELSEGEKSHHCLVCDEKTDVTIIRLDSLIDNIVYMETDGITCDDEITYFVKVKAGVGVSGSVFGAVFDPNVLEPVEEKCGAATSIDGDGNVTNKISGLYMAGMKHNTDDTYLIANINVRETTRKTDCEYMQFTFRVKSASVTETNIDFYCTEFSGTPKISKNDFEVVISEHIDIEEHELSNDWFYDYQKLIRKCTCLACGGYVEEPFLITDILTFTIDGAGETYTVTDCNSDFSGNIEIPEEFKGLPVTGIGNDAFRDCTKVKSVIMPDSVTDVGASAFRNCAALEEIRISENVTKVLGATYFGCTNLLTVDLPDSIKRLDGYSFASCTKLKSVGIPDSITNIIETSFLNCNEMVIFCNEDSFAHTYAIDNNLSYVTNTELTNVDLLSSIVCTHIPNGNNGNIISGSDDITYEINGSLVATGVEFSIKKENSEHSKYILAVYGDTNGDSVCDVLDCFDVERASNGNGSLSGAFSRAGDINSDDVIDVMDYQAIVNKALS